MKAIIESVNSSTEASHEALDTGLRAQVVNEFERLNGLIAALGATTALGDPCFAANLKLQKLEPPFVELDRRVQGALSD